MATLMLGYEASQSTKDQVTTWGVFSASSTLFQDKVEAFRGFFFKALLSTHGIHVIDTQLTARVQ